MFGHLREFWRELGSLTLYTASSLVGALYQPPPTPAGAARPVVLVPGFLGRGLAFLRLRDQLAAQGHPVYIADLGFGVGCIRQKSRQLEAFIEDHELEDFYLVGHSMGGVISLGMSDEACRRVRHFITLGTAYRGAILSRLVPIFPAARQLHPDSSLIREVIKKARRRDNLTLVVARWDEISFPRRACLLDGSCEEIIGVAGHAELILNSTSCEQVSKLISRLDASSHTASTPKITTNH